MKWFGRKEENYPHEKKWEKTSFTSHFKKRYFSIPLCHIFYFEWEILIPSQSRERAKKFFVAVYNFVFSFFSHQKLSLLNIFFLLLLFVHTTLLFIAVSAFVLFSFSIKGKKYLEKSSSTFYTQCFFFSSISQWKQNNYVVWSLYLLLYLSLSLSLFNFLSRYNWQWRRIRPHCFHKH